MGLRAGRKRALNERTQRNTKVQWADIDLVPRILAQDNALYAVTDRPREGVEQTSDHQAPRSSKRVQQKSPSSTPWTLNAREHPSLTAKPHQKPEGPEKVEQRCMSSSSDQQPEPSVFKHLRPRDRAHLTTVNKATQEESIMSGEQT